MTLEDVANQLLLPILGYVDPSALELSLEEEAVKAKLRKGMSNNSKLSHWVGSFSKASIAARPATLVTFWLYKFIFGSHPHYAMKPLYFQLAIKIFNGVSLPLAPMFLGHLYVQLDILGVMRIKQVPAFIVLFYRICYMSAMLGIWQSVGLFTLPRRDTGHARELLLIYVVGLSLIFRWLFIGLV